MTVTSLPLKDVADVIRSKNAGPFELTLDVIFKDPETFNAVKNAGVFNTAMIVALYDISADDVLNIVHYKPALAIKVTLRRSTPSGSVGDRDVYGAQQHAPLLDIKVPVQNRRDQVTDLIDN